MADEGKIAVQVVTTADTSGAEAAGASVEKLKAKTDDLKKSNEQLKDSQSKAKETGDDDGGKLKRLAGYTAGVVAVIAATRKMSEALQEAAKDGDVFAQAQAENLRDAEDAANRMWAAIGNSALGRGAIAVYDGFIKAIERGVVELNRLTESGRESEKVNKRMKEALERAGKMGEESMGRAADAVARLNAEMGAATTQADRLMIKLEAEAEIERAKLTSEGSRRIEEEHEITMRLEAKKEEARIANWEAEMKRRHAAIELLQQEIDILDHLAMADAEKRKDADKLRGQVTPMIEKYNADVDAEGTRRYREEQAAEVRRAKYEADLRRSQQREAEDRAREAQRAQQEQDRTAAKSQTDQERAMSGIRRQFGRVVDAVPGLGDKNAETATMAEILDILKTLHAAARTSKAITDAQKRELRELRRQVEMARLQDNAQ